MPSSRVEADDPNGSAAVPGEPTDGRHPTALELLLRPGADPGSGGPPEAGRTVSRVGANIRRWPRPIVVPGAVILVALLWSSWELVQRPPPLEDRMPVASAGSPATVASAGPGSTSTSGTESAAPDASVPPTQIVVHVAGAVQRPGLALMEPGDRVGDAVAAVGGFSVDADTDRTNLAAVLVDGSWIAIPRVDEEAPVEVTTSVAPSAEASSGATGGAGGAGTGSTPLDINTASAEELEELPGVGPATAAAIVAHREQNGPFSSVEGLLEVRGIGEAKLDAMRDTAVVGGA